MAKDSAVAAVKKSSSGSKKKISRSRGGSESGGDHHSSGSSHHSKIRCVLVGDGACGKSSLIHAYMNHTFPEKYTPTVFDDYATEVSIGKKKLQLKIRDTAGQEDYDRLRPLSYDDVNVAVVCYDVTNHDSFLNVEVRWHPELEHFCPEMPKVLVACKCDHVTDDEATIAGAERPRSAHVTSPSPPPHQTDGRKRNDEDDELVVGNEDSGLAMDDAERAPSGGHDVTTGGAADEVKVSTRMGAELCGKIGADCFVECSARTGHNIDFLFAKVVHAVTARRQQRKKHSCAIL